MADRVTRGPLKCGRRCELSARDGCNVGVSSVGRGSIAPCLRLREEHDVPRSQQGGSAGPSTFSVNTVNSNFSPQAIVAELFEVKRYRRAIARATLLRNVANVGSKVPFDV